MSIPLSLSLHLTHQTDRCMNHRTKAPHGHSACSLKNILDRLRTTAFQAAAWVYPWQITLYISSMDYTRPLGYLYVIYTGILPILMHPHWNYSRHMCTTTHISIKHTRKGILSHHDHSTTCSHFLIIQLHSASFEYLPSTGKPLISFSTLLARSCNELKPSISLCEGTHVSLVVVL